MDSTPLMSPAPKEAGIVQRVRRRLKVPDSPPHHVLVACSGGADSVVLAWMLAELGGLGLIRLTLGHVHHHQNDHGDAAAAAVREIGERLSIDVRIAHLNQSDIDRHEGVGTEEAMRRARYLALARIAAEVGADTIALAHHQQDQAETVLLHLIRGSGLDGLTGMREHDERVIPWWNDDHEPMTIRLWRPFLTESAKSVKELAVTTGLPIVEDASNADPRYRRNAIRHQVLPLLEEIAAGSTAAIARSATVLQNDQVVISRAIEHAAMTCIEGESLDRKAVYDLPPEYQPGVVRYWLQRRGLANDLAQERIDAIVHLAVRNRGGSRIELTAGWSVHLNDGYLSVRHQG